MASYLFYSLCYIRKKQALKSWEKQSEEIDEVLRIKWNTTTFCPEKKKANVELRLFPGNIIRRKYKMTFIFVIILLPVCVLRIIVTTLRGIICFLSSSMLNLVRKTNNTETGDEECYSLIIDSYFIANIFLCVFLYIQWWI